MVLAALAKAAAKGGKKTATKAAKRKTGAKAGDNAYNARRRYQRSAQRNLKAAEESTGATAARYRQLARQDLDNALATYDQSTTQNFNREITGIANELGVDLQQQRRRMQAMKQGSAQKLRESAISEEKSASRLVSTIEDDESRRQAEAREIINSKIGHRIIGGLVDVWKDDASFSTDEGLEVDNRKILPALFDYFNVDNLADMLEKVEEIIGDKLYGDEDNEEMYEAVKILLQKHVVSNPVSR